MVAPDIDNQVASETQLLTPAEKAMCEKIVALNESPHSQRASMLLAIDAGETQAQSAMHAGISIGHLKYWLKKFRETRLAIFPNVLQDSFDLAIEAPTMLLDGETEKPKKIKKVKKVAKKSKKVEKKKKDKKTKEVKEKKEKSLKKKKNTKGKSKKNKKNKAGKKQKKSKKDKKKTKNKKSKK